MIRGGLLLFYLVVDGNLLSQIRSLEGQGHLKKCGGTDWLDGGLRLTCHSPLDIVGGLADELRIRLDEVLF